MIKKTIYLFTELKRKLRENNFLKSVLTLSSGVIFAQAINFAGTPFISRIYRPSDIGDYTTITANAGVIGAIACLGMMTAFMLPKKDDEAKALCKLVTISIIFLSSIMIFFLWLIQPYYRFFNVNEISYDLALTILWLYTTFYFVSNICYAYANRQKLYKIMFWNPIIASIVNIITGIIFGLIEATFVGYSFAHIISFAANIIHLLKYANPYKTNEGTKYNFIALLREYKFFPIYQMPANLVSTSKVQIETQMISSLFSSTSLGMYSMAMRILSLPLTLLATPVNRVYYQEANQRYNEGKDIGEFSFNILNANIKIAIIPIVLLIIFGENLFTLFLGEQWGESGNYAAILGIYQIILFCGNCLSGGLTIIRKNNFNLIISVYSLISTIIVYIVAFYYISDIYLLLCLMSIVGISVVLITEGIFFYFTGVKIKKYVYFIFKNIIIPVTFAWIIKIEWA